MAKNQQTICLNMIVKDEAHIIERTLQNLLDHIPLTYWVICDTGSTDDTCGVIERFFQAKNIQGEMHKNEWKGFGKSRSEALDCAFGKTDYLFIFDADDSIHGNFVFPAVLTSDSYMFKFGQGFSYERPLLINNRKKWKYVGVLHEYLTEATPPQRGHVTIQGDYYVESGRLGARSQMPQHLKYAKDAEVLEREMAIEPDKALCDRYAFYLAQSYRDAGNPDKALECYIDVLSRKNWQSEKYYAAMMAGQIFSNHKQDFENTVKYLTRTADIDDCRFDGLIMLMEFFHQKDMHYMVDIIYSRIQQNYHKLDLTNKLFVLDSLYHEVMDYVNVISCFYTKNFASGYGSIKKIVGAQKLPRHKMDATLNNMIFYQDCIKNDPDEKESANLFRGIVQILAKKCGAERQDISPNECTIFNVLLEKNKKMLTKYKAYKPNKPNKSCEPKKTKKPKEPKEPKESLINRPKVMITFTTCKRFGLFSQTVNSILNTWLDADQIDCWFCVDDNSSETDRVNMKKLYPWMTYYMKTEEEKGHMQSMNIIWAELAKHKPIYWIHMEDDFLFFDHDRYVEKAIRGLNLPCMQQEGVHQMLFNRSYAETIDGYNISSHVYLPKDDSMSEDTEKNDYCIHSHEKDSKNPKINCHYWPHYSFRPSMMRTEIILQLGNFDTDVTFFEREYANKYFAAGYKSGFFNKLTNLHTGRLTKDQHNANIPNAYQLNNTTQFNGQQHVKQQVMSNKDVSVDAETSMQNADVSVDAETSMQNADVEHTINSLIQQIQKEDAEFFTSRSEAQCMEIINARLAAINPDIQITSIAANNIATNNVADETRMNPDDSDKIRMEIHELPTSGAEPTSKVISSMHQKTPYIKIVNLDRRQDRKAKVEAELARQHMPTDQYEFVKAVDGLALEVTDEIIDVFEGNDFGNRKGVIGCALSHMNLWKQLLEDPDHDFYLVMEDDVTLATDCTACLGSAQTQLTMKNTDLLFFGYHMFDKKRQELKQVYNGLSDYNGLADATNESSVTQEHTYIPYRSDLYIGGTFMYSVNKMGARKIMQHIEKHGVKHGIDYFIKKMQDLNIYECRPQLCFSVWNEGGATIDTDIQNTGVAFQLNRALVKDPDFVFVPKMDQVNYDMGQKFIPIAALKKEVLQMPECVAFNTLKFLKSHVDELHQSNYFQGNDGIYIKTAAYARLLEDSNPIKKEQKMVSKQKTRIKMMCDWCDPKTLCDKWKTMCKDSLKYTWNHLEFVWTDDGVIDYYVIINKPRNANQYFIPEKTIVFQMEPWVADEKCKWGAKTWGPWAVPDERRFLKVIGRKTADAVKEYNNASWQLELTYSQLSQSILDESAKEDAVACICSSKYNDPGHVHRIDFLHFVETKQRESVVDETNLTEDHVVPLAVFSATNFGAFQGYRGALPMAEKSKGYVPFKYYFMCENNYEVNYVTEKLWEPILCECLCFYYGCPNVGDYLDNRAYVQLDMEDFEKSYAIMQQAVKEDWWSQRIEYIRKEKHRILNEMQFCPRLEQIIHEYETIN
jgi:GR25 family glycosyltransferase involved in LPS biosynthesis/glycosyltransferase involved in cell wall biosynthesis